jgi:hypothetical protein
MDFNRLEQNLTDNIYEAQLKLGYERRPISLNYMLASLNHLMGTELDTAGMEKALLSFAEYAAPRFGKMTYRPVNGGFCFVVPVEGVSYVHNNAPESSFIAELVAMLRRHDLTMDDVLELFRSFSGNVSVTDMSSSGEFDLLVYFPDGVPDSYRYCLAFEDDFGCCHVTYHRFIPEDYADLGF